MNQPKVPKAWLTAGTKKPELRGANQCFATIDELGLFDPTKVTARIDMSAEVAGAGLCPDCRKPMDKAFANGIEVFVCHPDRIAIPVADPVEEGAEETAVLGPSTAEPGV